MVGLRIFAQANFSTLEESMESLPNGFTLELNSGSFPLSTDSMVLSAFVHLPRNAQVLDLGSGCGTLGLLLCSRKEDCHITGVELQNSSHLGALENIQRNNLSARMESICADLRSVPSLLSAGGFSACVSNPPYFSGGPASCQTPLARREDCCTPEDLFRSAAWALKYGGDFFLVHKPERMAELIAIASRFSLEAKRLGLVRHRENGPVALILLQFRKGGKPGLKWEDWTLHHADGTPTSLYHEIYHI